MRSSYRSAPPPPLACYWRVNDGGGKLSEARNLVPTLVPRWPPVFPILWRDDVSEWRCGAESNRRIELLQSSALPLGYRTGSKNGGRCREKSLRASVEIRILNKWPSHRLRRLGSRARVPEGYLPAACRACMSRSRAAASRGSSRREASNCGIASRGRSRSR